MDEYIKRDAVHDAVSKLKRLAWQSSTTSPNAESCVAVELDAVHLAIEQIPAADVRPAVLCRDCKFAPVGDKDGSDLEWPFNEFDENPCPYKCLDNWYSHKPSPDFFCAAGEKREES